MKLKPIFSVLKTVEVEVSPFLTRGIHSAQLMKCTNSRTSEKSAKKSQSFALDLFRGHIDCSQIFPYPQTLSPHRKAKLKKIVDSVDSFMEVYEEGKSNESETLSDNALHDLFKLGVLSMEVPDAYGGMGLQSTECARILEQFATYELGISGVIASHQLVGFKGILIFGTPEQKSKYLPLLTSQTTIAAFCLSEATAGSDVSCIESRAFKSPDGKYYVLNGRKTWIANGGNADILTVFAYTAVKNEETGRREDKITAFIVERAFNGVTIGPAQSVMGMQSSNPSEVVFKDVQVPVGNVLGGVGNGFKVAMTVINNGRLGHTCLLSGAMKNAITKSANFASNRVQFGINIASFGSIQEKLARMSVLQYVTESCSHLLSELMNVSHDVFIEATISKILSNESAVQVIDDAMTVMGAKGYSKGTRLERMYRDARAFKIVEGCCDTLRPYIAVTGLKHAQSHLRSNTNSLPPSGTTSKCDNGTDTKTWKGSVTYGSGQALSECVHPDLHNSMEMTLQAVAEFGVVVKSALIHEEKKIMHNQFLLNRFANVAIDLYSMIVTLSRCTASINSGIPSASHEALMTKIWCKEACNRTMRNLAEISSEEQRGHFSTMIQISNNISRNGSTVQKHPISF